MYNETTKNYISLETPLTAKDKGKYVKNNVLAGCFSWSGDQDDGLLTNACREGMGYEISVENFPMANLYNKGEEFDMPGSTKIKKIKLSNG